MRATWTGPLRRELTAALPSRPFAVELWDGTAVPATQGDSPTFALRSPRALAHLVRSPNQLGVGRAYVAGDPEGPDPPPPLRGALDYKPPPPTTPPPGPPAPPPAPACGPAPR